MKNKRCSLISSNKYNHFEINGEDENQNGNAKSKNKICHKTKDQYNEITPLLFCTEIIVQKESSGVKILNPFLYYLFWEDQTTKNKTIRKVKILV